MFLTLFPRAMSGGRSQQKEMAAHQTCGCHATYTGYTCHATYTGLPRKPHKASCANALAINQTGAMLRKWRGKSSCGAVESRVWQPGEGWHHAPC